MEVAGYSWTCTHHLSVNLYFSRQRKLAACLEQQQQQQFTVCFWLQVKRKREWKGKKNSWTADNHPGTAPAFSYTAFILTVYWKLSFDPPPHPPTINNNKFTESLPKPLAQMLPLDTMPVYQKAMLPLDMMQVYDRSTFLGTNGWELMKGHAAPGYNAVVWRVNFLWHKWMTAYERPCSQTMHQLWWVV